MKLRNLLFVFLAAAVGSVYAVGSQAPLIYMSGGGSVRPAATNAVLETAMAYTDQAISRTFLLTEAHVSDGTTNYYPSATAAVLSSNTITFYVDDDQSTVADCYFEILSEVGKEVYIAQKTEVDNVWTLVFTCGTLGQPIDFYLVCSVQTYGDDKSIRQVIFKLRRTF